METIQFEKSAAFLRRVFSEYPKGELKVICPRCRAEMQVALSQQDAARLNRSRGLYCPNGHIQSVFTIR